MIWRQISKIINEGVQKQIDANSIMLNTFLKKYLGKNVEDDS